MEVVFTFNYRSGNVLLTRHITDCDVEKITRLFNEGHGMNAIGQEMKMSYIMIGKIFDKLGLKRERIEALQAKKNASPLPKTGKYASLK